LILDKNHPPNGVPGACKVLDGAVSKDIHLVKIGLKPQVINPVFNLPFSVNFMVQCMLRLLNRKDHETLSSANNTNTKLVSIFLMFAKLYDRVTFEEKTGLD
jgi:hypothetical protein